MSTIASNTLISTHDVRKDYARKRLTTSDGGVECVVDCVSLSILRGEIVGLVGESGSGKSTLGRMILGLIKPTGGFVKYDGVDVWSVSDDERRSMRAKAQIVFQDPFGALNPRRTIGENIELPLLNFGWAKNRRWQRVEEVLTQVGLNPAHANRFSHQFSGGQCQRAVIARAIALQPEFLFLDEPVSALDVSVQAQILNLLSDLRRTFSLTYLFVSHDLRVVRHLCDRTAVLFHGQLVEFAPSADIYERPLHPYTQALRAAVLDVNEGINTETTLGQSDSPKSALPPSEGCRFAPQCPMKRDICVREHPPLLEQMAGHWLACHAHDSIEPRPQCSKFALRGTKQGGKIQ